MQTRITVNGREYRSVEEMPPDVRRQYERAMQMLRDRDGDGVPDVFEAKAPPPQSPDGGVTILHRSSRYVVNGREYDRWEDIPPDLQQTLRGARQGKGTMVTRITPQPAPGGHLPGGGITIHIPWSKLFAIIAALTVVALIAWLAS